MSFDWSSPRATQLLLGAILVLTLALRLPSIYGTLPDIYNHDQLNYVDGALRVGSGEIMGGSFKEYPLSRIVYFLLFACFGVWFVIGRLTGMFANVDDFVVAYVMDPSQLLLILRMVMLAATLGTVWLVYAVGKRLFDRRVGLCASFLAAISFPLVYMAFAKDDIFLTFFMVLSLYSAIRIVEQPSRLSLYVMTGVALAAASASKYLGLLGIPLLLIAAWQGSMPQRVNVWRPFLWGCAAFLVTFVCFVPSAVLDPTRLFVRSLVLVTEGNSGARFAQTLGRGSWYGYMWSTYATTTGIVFAGLFYSAAIFIFWKRLGAGLLLLVYPLTLTMALTVSVLAGKGAEAPHYELSAIPFMCVAVGYMLASILSSSFQFSRWAVACLILLVVVDNVGQAWVFNRMSLSGDSRTMARTWVESHIPGGSSVLLEGAIHTFIWEGPQLKESKATLVRDLQEIQAKGGSGKMVQAKLRALDRAPLSIPSYDLHRVENVAKKDLEEVKPAYVVVRSEQGRKVVETSPVAYRVVFSIIPKSQHLFQLFPVLSLRDLQRLRDLPLLGESGTYMPGPAIWIYQLDDAHAS